MKICAIICEYNPFHNGHKYLIDRARELSGCDFILCLMSGSFTQRGEAAILPKFTRAEHAIEGGADCVLQLPALFSVAPAEIFARGAISILKAIPAVSCLAFGSENAAVNDIVRAADILSGLNSEGAKKTDKTFTSNMGRGQSYKRSVACAMEELGAESRLITSPNGILAVEYARAIKESGAHISLLPTERVGGGYGDGALKENYSSASAIRKNISDIAIRDNVPVCVYTALTAKDRSGAEKEYDMLARYALLMADKSDMRRIFGCTEGLENKLKASANLPLCRIIEEATSRRYTSSRIRRIIAANLLGLYSDDAIACIEQGTYLKPLAVRESCKDEIFAELAKSRLPLIVKQRDLAKLSEGEKFRRSVPSAPQERCYECDLKADFVRALIYGEEKEYEYTVKVIR